MSTALEKYLHDHLAGAAFAIDLLGALCRKHENDAFSDQLRLLLAEIERDRDELAVIAKRLGVEPGGMKEGMARFFEKMSRPKLVNDSDDIFSSFEACETVALGILGKRALWEALAASIDTARSDVNFARLKQRADNQHVIIEKLRLDLGSIALRGSARNN